MQNIFKVKNRTTEQRYSLCCGVFIVDLNIQTPFSRIFIADFEYVFFSWEAIKVTLKELQKISRTTELIIFSMS